MKSLAFAPGTSLLLTQTPPAEYEKLEIVYRLVLGPVLIESRSGSIRLNDSAALAADRWIVAPKRNAAGKVSLLELNLSRPDGGTTRFDPPTPNVSSASVSWEVPQAAAGDLLTFKIEQPVDLQGHAPEANAAGRGIESR